MTPELKIKGKSEKLQDPLQTLLQTLCDGKMLKVAVVCKCFLGIMHVLCDVISHDESVIIWDLAAYSDYRKFRLAISCAAVSLDSFHLCIYIIYIFLIVL